MKFDLYAILFYCPGANVSKTEFLGLVPNKLEPPKLTAINQTVPNAPTFGHFARSECVFLLIKMFTCEREFDGCKGYAFF